jgi:hypothetical protein
MGSGVAVVGACCKEGGIGARVGIRARVGTGAGVGTRASSSKDVFVPSRISLLLYRALSIVYSGGVGE